MEVDDMGDLRGQVADEENEGFESECRRHGCREQWLWQWQKIQ